MLRLIKKTINTYLKFTLVLKKKVWIRRLKRIAIEYQDPVYVGGPCIFTGKIYLGKNCNFNGMKILGDGIVRIGDNFHSGIECMMITQNHDYDDGNAIPYGDKYHLKTINIGDNVWLGNRVTLIGNLEIGEGAIVAAGAVVTRDIPSYSIVGGNPAKIIKYRNIKRYQFLKSEGKFH